jgi:uncharacterized protein YkwD
MQSPFLAVLLLLLLIDVRATDEGSDGTDDALLSHLVQRVLRRYFARRTSSSDQQPDNFDFTDQQRQIQKEVLNTHNTLRAQHCSPPLVLDDEINIHAQVYANILAVNESKLVHSTNRKGRFGENLYTMMRGNPIKVIDSA